MNKGARTSFYIPLKLIILITNRAEVYWKTSSILTCSLFLKHRISKTFQETDCKIDPLILTNKLSFMWSGGVEYL